MKVIEQQLLTGERALFKGKDLIIKNSTFADGESPLKEGRNLEISNSIFKWKYPLWYCNNVEVTDSTLLETARSGIWYTNDIRIKDTIIEAPKTFRRGRNITLENVDMPIAEETLWNCKNIKMKNVQAKGNYFGMNSSDIVAENFKLSGNYAFDGGKNIEIHNAKMLSKDSFWNCENVTVYDSTIIGEYIGWNSKNLTFVNCTIDSLQGFCYIDNLVLKNCKLLNTNLTFEYCTVEADVTTKIDSVKNPISGTIRAKGIDETIMDDPEIDPEKTHIILEEK
ncbi:MAG: DUF3737 family protein [Clostridium sp.]|nr:DUF3737 family protein [Clostridium sp.]